MRYPVLIVLGPSFTGKTKWVHSLFADALELTIGGLEHFPIKMKKFDRKRHDGLILDDVRDMEFLAANQDKIQAVEHRAIEFASTAGGTCAFEKYLYQVPIAITVNYSTKNLHFLQDHDWLKMENNRVLVVWPDALRAAEASA